MFLERPVVMNTATDSLRRDDGHTPTATHFNPSTTLTQLHPIPSHHDSSAMEPTPTRDSFTLSEKRPLSPQRTSPDLASVVTHNHDGDLSRQESLQSLKSNDTQGSSNTGAVEDGPEDSDNEEEGSAYRPQKKKKSQRFYCTQYPPCNLSFTRNEHLARHIRKHTGERPFTCHCLRKFSRLDNLRQHAQTVHVNEDIPMDSLAATGTRFQRQIRTERMRTPGHRQRASTLSNGSQSRGHSRNLSGSSVGSVSDFGTSDDARRRPQPLAMATPSQSRPGLSVDTSGANMSPPFYNYPPSGYSTPISAYSAEATSPRMASVLGSPIAMMPRTTIGWGGQNSSRRFSGPSGMSPYHGQQHFVAPQAPFLSPVMQSAMPNMGNSSAISNSPPRDGIQHQRTPSIDAVEAEWRRRTWHPSTRNSFGSRPATSGLSYQQRPDDPQAVPTTQPAAQQAVRLPGIDSFDRSSIHSSSSARRMPDGMDADEMSLAGETDASSKRNSWNSMNQHLTQLELSQNTPPRDGAVWRHSIGSNPQNTARPMIAPYPGPGVASHTNMSNKLTNMDDLIDPNLQQPPAPSLKKKRGMLMDTLPLSPGAGEPGPAIRTSPDGSANSEEVRTPSTTVDYRPAIVHSDGHIERQSLAGMEDAQKAQLSSQPNVLPYPPDNNVHAPADNRIQSRGHDTQRLDALVAVATSEDQAIAQH